MHMPQHLNDEHMRMYEWTGAGAGIAAGAVAKPRWRASHGVLAVLTSLLILSGCDKQETAAVPGEQVEQSAADAQPAYNEAPTGSAEAGAPTSDMGAQPEAVSPVEGGQPLDGSAAPVEESPQQP